MYKLIFMSSVLLALALACTSCGKGNKETADQNQGNIVITRIANPDESLNALVQAIKPAEWVKFYDKKTSINSADPHEICLNIGARSANALLAVYLGDYDSASAIAAAIKEAGGRLNVKAPKVESAARSLLESSRETDEKQKAIKVKQDINELSAQISSALGELGSPDYAILILYGGWLESVRQVSGILKDRYSETAVLNTLSRADDAKYFKSEFEALSLKMTNAVLAASLESVSRILPLMGSLKDKKSVAKIYETADKVNLQFVK